jgi:hypothetical protein
MGVSDARVNDELAQIRNRIVANVPIEKMCLFRSFAYGSDPAMAGNFA